MNPFSEVAADPKLHAVEFHALGADQVRVVGVDVEGAEVGSIASMSAGFAQGLVADAGIRLGPLIRQRDGVARAVVLA